MHKLYQNRLLTRGYPDLEKLGVDYFKSMQSNQPMTAETLQCLGRLIDLNEKPRTATIIGCGPNPFSVKIMMDLGFDVVGIEPVPDYQKLAGEFLNDPERILLGSAEKIPIPDQSQRLVFMESVLEHVDSPQLSISEAYRVLLPGGVLFIQTTNRTRFSITGKNSEFRTLFYNWFPALVKECYVYKHLHFDPRLANFTPHPAVHWFTYTDLCQLGRQVGFAHFYSILDLMDLDSPSVKLGYLKKYILRLCRYRPWLRALALTQIGGMIFMWKRNDSGLQNVNKTV